MKLPNIFIGFYFAKDSKIKSKEHSKYRVGIYTGHKVLKHHWNTNKSKIKLSVGADAYEFIWEKDNSGD